MVQQEKSALVIKELKNVTLGELAEGYVDNSENVGGGVFAWGGKLIVRPEFQRSFVVDGNYEWQTNLIDSVLNHKPIGLMYFGIESEKKDVYYNIDGQQRLMTLLSFIKGELALPMIKDDGTTESVLFNQMPEEWQRTIKQYTPLINVCMGSEEELLKWFRTINQPVCILTDQELRNAAYNGVWCEIAKRAFSKSKTTEKPTAMNGFVMAENSRYYYGNYAPKLSPERQDVLEMAIDWITKSVYGSSIKTMKSAGIDPIECYMAEHQHDTNADELINHYKSVVDWIWDVFFHDGAPKNWQSVRSQDWGRLYAEYKDMPLTEEQKMYISKRTKEIVGYGASVYQKTDGIYEWVLRGEKKEEENTYLHLRGFSPEDKSAMYNAQDGYDPIDGQHYDVADMHAHHIKSWRSGGDSKYDNLVWLSKETHRKLHAGDLGISGEELKNLRDELIKRNKSK